MKEKLLKWSQAGDGDCMFKLAKIYRNEGNFQQYVHWLEKSAATKNFDAMKEFADYLRGSKNPDYERALAIYRELAETYLDEESMEKIVDICELNHDNDTLNFVLELINKTYNEIYLIDRGNIIARTWVLQTRRHDECTWEYLQAVERRRIAARIRRILAED